MKATPSCRCLSPPYGCDRTHSRPVYTHGSGWWTAGCVCSRSPLWRRGPSSSLHLWPHWVCNHPGSSGHSTAGPGPVGRQECVVGKDLLRTDRGEVKSHHLPVVEKTVSESWNSNFQLTWTTWNTDNLKRDTTINSFSRIAHLTFKCYLTNDNMLLWF